MSLRNPIIFSVLIAILLPWYYLAGPVPPNTAKVKEKQEPLLNIRRVETLAVSNGQVTIRYRLSPDGRRYEIAEPPGKFVPQDLINETIAILKNVKSVEVVSTNPREIAEFGLDHYRTELVIGDSRKSSPIEIQFGDENPAGTAVYARVKGHPEVFLMGKILETYQRLMFDWVERQQGQ